MDSDNSEYCCSLPRCPADLLRHSPYMVNNPVKSSISPRILVFFSNLLFRVSDMSWCTFLFSVTFCNFSPVRVSCPLIQFCPENSGFSPHACIVLRNSFFPRIFSNFPPVHYRVTKLFFCAHFCAFYVFTPLLPFAWKVRKNCCHAPIYYRVT